MLCYSLYVPMHDLLQQLAGAGWLFHAGRCPCVTPCVPQHHTALRQHVLLHMSIAYYKGQSEVPCIWAAECFQLSLEALRLKTQL